MKKAFLDLKVSGGSFHFIVFCKEIPASRQCIPGPSCSKLMNSCLKCVWNHVIICAACLWRPIIELKVRYLSYLCSHITYSAGHLRYRRLFYWVCELDIFIFQTLNQLQRLYYNMDFNICESNRGQKSMIYDGYVFQVDNVLKSGDISWCCMNKNVRVTVLCLW